jgi:hypothetical protein
MFFVTFALISGVSIAAFVSSYPYIPIWASVVGWVLLSIVLIAFIFTACSNPGIVERSQESQGPLSIYDDMAKCYRPHTSIYDAETQVLMDEVDHFCPW